MYGEDYLAEVVHTTFTPAAAVGTAPVQVQVHINITIIDDNQGEPLERFRVIITSPDARVSILGGGITVTIKDNESMSYKLYYMETCCMLMIPTYCSF